MSPRDANPPGARGGHRDPAGPSRTRPLLKRNTGRTPPCDPAPRLRTRGRETGHLGFPITRGDAGTGGVHAPPAQSFPRVPNQVKTTQKRPECGRGGSCRAVSGAGTVVPGGGGAALPPLFPATLGCRCFRAPPGQKVHRSCARLSLPEPAPLGVCRVESSPLRLFLQTGHVSCSSNQGTMQLLWKRWLQGSCRTCSAGA